jgi:hypothetical protein
MRSIYAIAAACGALIALWAVPAAQASSATSCRPHTMERHGVLVNPGAAFDGVMGRVTCLPLGETLQSIVIDWHDGAPPSQGTATYEVDQEYGAQDAMIHGAHTYNTMCAAAGGGLPGYCPPITPTITAATASDGTTVPAYAYDFAVWHGIDDKPEPPRMDDPVGVIPPRAQLTVSARVAGSLTATSALISVKSSERGKAAITLTATKPKLRIAFTQTVAAGSRTVRVALPAKARVALRHRRALSVRLSIALTASDGTIAHHEGAVRLIRAK